MTDVNSSNLCLMYQFYHVGTFVVMTVVSHNMQQVLYAETLYYDVSYLNNKNFSVWYGTVNNILKYTQHACTVHLALRNSISEKSQEVPYKFEFEVVRKF